jgi:hypothetical protein
MELDPSIVAKSLTEEIDTLSKKQGRTQKTHTYERLELQKLIQLYLLANWSVLQDCGPCDPMWGDLSTILGSEADQSDRLAKLKADGLIMKK